MSMTNSTPAEALRDPEYLARFVIEDEWALESEGEGKNGSGMADWRETLDRVFDAWDADTPDDILSAIAAAIRLDRAHRFGRHDHSEAEIDAAARAIHAESRPATLRRSTWDDLAHAAQQGFRREACAALLAAQEVRR